RLDLFEHASSSMYVRGLCARPLGKRQELGVCCRSAHLLQHVFKRGFGSLSSKTATQRAHRTSFTLINKQLRVTRRRCENIYRREQLLLSKVTIQSKLKIHCAGQLIEDNLISWCARLCRCNHRQ